jgi:hypothetical protein
VKRMHLYLLSVTPPSPHALLIGSAFCGSKAAKCQGSETCCATLLSREAAHHSANAEPMGSSNM